MADDTKETTEEKPVVTETPPVVKLAPAKKPPAKKKVTAQQPSSTEENLKAAAVSRKALIERLKKDLKKAKDAAKEELKLARAAARDEIAVLKDQLAAALGREAELRKLSEKKIKKMLVAGERWERKQRARLKKAARKVRKKLKN